LLERAREGISSFGFAKSWFERWPKPNVPIVRWLPQLLLGAKECRQNKIFIELVILF